MLLLAAVAGHNKSYCHTLAAVGLYVHCCGYTSASSLRFRLRAALVKKHLGDTAAC
jgi:hypothetical protein